MHPTVVSRNSGVPILPSTVYSVLDKMLQHYNTLKNKGILAIKGASFQKKGNEN